MIRNFSNSRIPAAFVPVVRSRRVRAAGQATAPSSQGDQQFQLVALPLPDYNITDPNGTIINPADIPQLRTGAMMHWIDTDLAAACFAEARKQMDIAVSAAGQDPSNDDAGLIAMHQAMAWIMAGYNALNVPWYMDPVARTLYRQFIAGPPQQTGSVTTYAEFGSGPPNYNDNWFVPGHIDPGFSQGSVSQQMKDLISKVPELNDPNTMQVPTIWPITVIPQDLGGPGLAAKSPLDVSITFGGGSTANVADPTYAQNIQNYFLFNQFQNEQDYSIVIPPVYCENPGPNCQSRSWKNPAGPNIDNNHPLAGVKNGSWRTFSWQNSPFNPKLISTPMIFYVPWLDAWSSMLVNRQPQDIAVSARLYTIYVNAAKASNNGGSSVFVNSVVALPGLENQLATTGGEQDTLRIAAAAVAGVGAAFAAFTYGISAVIGGGIALGLTVAGASIRNTPQIVRDDLGRFKPIIDRGWLAGNPAVAGDLGTPPIVVPAPPGWTRPLPAMAPSRPVVLYPTPIAPTPGSASNLPSNVPGNLPVQAPAADITNPASWGWMAGIAAGVVALYAGYRYLTAPRAVATTTPAPKANPRRTNKRRKQ